MKIFYENTFTMIKVVYRFLTSKIALWTGNVPLQDGYDSLNAKIGVIEAWSQIAELNRKGLAEAKAAKETLLIQKAWKIITAVIPYANKTNNAELKQAVNYKKSDLEKMRDHELVLTLKNIHDKTNEKIADLAPYGLLPANLTELETLTDDYDLYLTKPREGTTERKTANKMAVEEIKAARSILTDTIDFLVFNYEDTNKEFVDEYKNARTIIDLAGGRSEVEEGLLAAAETKNTFSDIEDTDHLKFENPGDTPIMVCRTDAPDKACTAGIKVEPGETVVKTGIDMGASGDYLNVTNLDAVNAGKYKVSRG